MAAAPAALLVIRPTLRETWTRGIARGAGTLLGAGVATAAAALLRPGPELTASLVVVSAWCAYALRRVHYAALSAAITCIVYLLALAGLPEPLNALHRTLATLLGGALALLASALVRARPAPPRQGVR